MAKKIAGPAVAGLMIKAFIDVSKKSAILAASAEEIRSKFGVVFGETASVVEDWARKYSEAVGRSDTDTLSFLGTIGDTLKPLGFAKEAVDKMSKQVVELAGDLGSFNDIPTEEVIKGIQSALVGNVETLRRYGVVANETSIKQEAFNSGLWDGTGAMSAQVKAQSILNITMKGTTDAQGDLLRTQDSATNTTIRLNSQIEKSLELYGKYVNEALTPVKSALADLITEWNKAVTAKQGFDEALNAGEVTDEFVVDMEEVKSTIQSMVSLSVLSSKKMVDGLQKNFGLSEIFAFELIQTYGKLDEAGQIAFERATLNAEKVTKAVALVEEANRLAAIAAEAEAIAEGHKLEVVEALELLRLGSLTSQEKEIELLQAQIDKWAELREVTGAQELINILIEKRNILLRESAGLLDEELTAEQLAADERLSIRLMEEEALKDRAKRMQVIEDDRRASELDKEKKLADLILQTREELLSSLLSTALSFASSFDTIFDNLASAQIERLEEEGGSEEDLAALRKKLAQENAEREKAIALVNIAINTASAIVKGFAELGPIGGAISAVALTALGITQAVAVATQPTAFAKGGDFMTNGPQTILVGDNPGGRERVQITPESSANINGPNGGGQIMVNIVGFGTVIANAVTDGTRNGDIQVFEGAIVA